MDIEHLIGTMVGGALTGRGKRSRGARRFLTGGGSAFLNASTLLTLGGLVWGAIETMQQQSTTPGAATPTPSTGLPPSSPTTTPVGLATPPRLPGTEAASPAPHQAADGATRLVQLMVSAARADGALDDRERDALLGHARRVDAETLVAAELARPTPLQAIVGGVTDQRQREDLYVLAFTIVRSDEAVSGAERIYLARLAALLDLDPRSVERVEQEAAARIDAAASTTAGDADSRQ